MLQLKYKTITKTLTYVYYNTLSTYTIYIVYVQKKRRITMKTNTKFVKLAKKLQNTSAKSVKVEQVKVQKALRQGGFGSTFSC